MIHLAQMNDAPAVAALACLLWPDHAPAEMTADIEALIARPDAAVFLACEGGRAVGFAQCQLRRDYVEGTDTSPVGYLEGIFVEDACRGRGLARALLMTCQDWAGNLGCREFASDCELDNAESLAFHLKCGFAEANRLICFAKKL